MKDKSFFEEVWVPIYNSDPGDEDDNDPNINPGCCGQCGPRGCGDIEPFDTDDEFVGREVLEVRHPNSMKFHRYLKEVANLHDVKQRDYGREEDPFANVRASEEWGIDGWVGAMIRLNDKVRRLQSLAVTGRLSNEGAIDSFMDIACYAIIARVLFEDESDKL